MVAAAELDPERHRHARDVAAAEHRVAAGHHDHGRDRVLLARGGLAHLALPGLVGPSEHGQREVLLALELVVEGAARVSGVARHLLEHEVAVAVAREAARG